MVRIHRGYIFQVRDARLGELIGLSGVGSVALATLSSGIILSVAQRVSLAVRMYYL